MYFLSYIDPGGHHHAAHLHEQLPAVQRDERARRAALRPLHGDPRQTRAVPEVPADHRQSREQIYQKMPGYCYGRGGWLMC